MVRRLFTCWGNSLAASIQATSDKGTEEGPSSFCWLGSHSLAVAFIVFVLFLKK